MIQRVMAMARPPQAPRMAAEADAEETPREQTHEGAPDEDGDARDVEDLLAVGLGVEVLAVDVVAHERGDGDGLGRAGRNDGHEEHDRDHPRAGGAEEVGGDGRRHEAAARLARGDRELEGDRGEAHGGGESERDREPDHAAEEVTLVRGGRLGGDGGLPVGLVNEDGAEVA